ncbi:MAG TPA: protein-methionine-sulfoxide reductase heme-binding subunit MsrQ [Bryobacteraceae bacterium]|nr:protein-methionine-sulfoxide reductase heme-binding subunit MsrQ [Bryobacteraceae bacterium]
MNRAGVRRREPLLGRILSSRWTKVVLFAACLVPILLLAWPLFILVTSGYSPELTANPIEYITHYTGTWTIRFLLIALSITPLRKIFNQPKLARYRRMLGLFAFFYVCLHFLIWFVLDKFFSFPDMWADILKRPYITVGMAGFAMLIPLAVTSTAGWVRRIGFMKWQRLHRLAYFAALAGVIHYYWLVKSDVRLPLMYAGILGVLMLYRLATRKPAPHRSAAARAASGKSPATTPNTASLPD